MAWSEDVPGFGLYHWAALRYDEILHPPFRECALSRLQCSHVGHVSSKYKLPGSSVGMATDYGLDGPGSNPE